VSGSDASEALLSVDGLTYESEGFRLGPVSFSLRRGETLVVMGPNGSGKSTLLRVLAGLEPPQAGQIVLGGRDISRAPSRERRMGLVFQDLALFPHLTVRENVRYGLTAHPRERAAAEARVDELLREFHLLDLGDRYATDISGGEQQRVAVARTLAPRPDLVLFDEPLSAADRVLRLELAQEIRASLAANRTPAIYVTHDVEEGLLFADRIALIANGMWLQEGPLSRVFARPATPFAAEFLGYNVLSTPKGLRGVFPSDLRVEKPAGLGSFPARVVLARVHGGRVRIICELPREGSRGRPRLVVAEPEHTPALDVLSPGDPVGLRWEREVSVGPPLPEILTRGRPPPT
jgi:ABC-type Fe3+/spermidine/putrescine transport system ATPase subunit